MTQKLQKDSGKLSFWKIEFWRKGLAPEPLTYTRDCPVADSEKGPFLAAVLGVRQALEVHRGRLVDADARTDGHLERRPSADETVRLRRLSVGTDDVSVGETGRMGLLGTPAANFA